MSYCTYCNDLPEGNLHKIYHDLHYGFPIEEDNELFGRLVLEINQAGLSWDTILKKQENFKKALLGFDINKVANFGFGEREKLLQNPGIIRNKLKVDAVIYNAQRIIELQNEFGSFKLFLNRHKSLELPEWLRLFKKNFKFVGGEIVKEFLQSSGYLLTPHDLDCPIFEKVESAKRSFDYSF